MQDPVAAELAEEEETEINLTPMLDVVFIMLIFFIVTASFIREQGIGGERPDPNQEVTQQEEKGAIFIIIASIDNEKTKFSYD